MALRAIRHFLAALLLTISTPALLLAGAETTIQVSAQVLPWLSAEVIQQISAYRVSSDDLKRGYIDLPAALLFRFRSNSSDRIGLRLDSLGPEQVLIKESDGIGAHLQRQLLSSTSTSPREERLDVRILLPGSFVPGIYPLQVMATTSLGG